MRKNIFSAVWATIVVLCTVVLSSCNSYDADMEDIIIPKDEVKQLSCGVIENSYAATGVITRAVDYNGTPDGVFYANSKHSSKFSYDGQTLERTYVGVNKVKAFRVNNPRYSSKLDIFKKATFIENQPLSDGRISYTVRFNDESLNFDFDLIEETVYDTDTLMVMGKSFNKCKNQFVGRKLAGDPEVTDLQQDSADWHAYKVVLPFEYTLEEGANNVGKFNVTIAKLWVAKAGTNPEFPEDKPETVMFEDKDFGFDFVNDTLSNSYFTLIHVLSNGTKVDGKTISVKLINKLFTPEYQEKLVANLNWNVATATAAAAVKNGAQYEKSENIFVQPYKQLYTTRTDKCDAVFTATFEGSAYYVDSLGKAHTFLDKQWSFADNDWTDKELTATTEYDRLLLTSAIIGTFNEHDHEAAGEVELKCRKGGASEILKYEYENFGIKSVIPFQKYNSYCDQYAVFSDGSKEKIGTLSIDLMMNINTPEKQVITVSDFNIQDQKATLSNAIRENSREDKRDNGTFKIQKFYKNYTTNTNKSDCKFVAHYEDGVIFVDAFGKEVTFKGIELTFADKGSSLEDLTEQDEMERKLLTSTITVACTTDSENYTGQVEFRKSVEKEELTSWSIKNQDLTYNGNGDWTSTTVITYNYKLAGEKTETYQQKLIWNVVGEAKKQVILSEAKADYNTMSNGSESSSSSTNGNVTVVTKTKTITENYTTLSDVYTQTTQTASYKAVVDGQTIAFDFLAPTTISVSHGNGSLTNANRTTTVSGVEYDVYNHVGSISYTANSKTENVSVEKEVLVKKAEVEEPDVPEIPYNPAWGHVVSLAAATLTYEPNAGSEGNGAFHKTLVVNYEKGKLIITTASFGPNAYDFTYDSNDFYTYGKEIQENYKINSAALFSGRWIPALITMDGSGWKYATMDGRIVNMDQNLALLCGIKNFNGQNTAANNPYLNYSATLSADKVLTIKNHLGGAILTLK